MIMDNIDSGFNPYLFFPFGVFYQTKDSFGYTINEMTASDLHFLYRILQKFKKDGMTVYEVGAWTGMSTCLIGSVVKGCKGRMVTVDNFKGSNDNQAEFLSLVPVRRLLERNLGRFGLEQVVTIIDGDSADVAGTVEDGAVDFVFVDGDHRYSGVKKDLDAWLPKIKMGGVLAGHDYNYPGYDEKHIEEDYVDGRHHGVSKALEETVPQGEIIRVEGKSSVWAWVKH